MPNVKNSSQSGQQFATCSKWHRNLRMNRPGNVLRYKLRKRWNQITVPLEVVRCSRSLTGPSAPVFRPMKRFVYCSILFFFVTNSDGLQPTSEPIENLQKSRDRNKVKQQIMLKHPAKSCNPRSKSFHPASDVLTLVPWQLFLLQACRSTGRVPGPSNYQKNWLFCFYGRLGRFVCFASFCGCLWSFCWCFACVLSVALTKTTRIVWSLEDPGIYKVEQ